MKTLLALLLACVLLPTARAVDVVGMATSPNFLTISLDGFDDSGAVTDYFHPTGSFVHIEPTVPGLWMVNVWWEFYKLDLTFVMQHPDWGIDEIQYGYLGQPPVPIGVNGYRFRFVFNPDWIIP